MTLLITLLRSYRGTSLYHFICSFTSHEPTSYEPTSFS